MKCLAPTLLLFVSLFCLTACSDSTQESTTNKDTQSASAPAPDATATPQPPELPHEPSGRAIEGLPYIAYLAQPVYADPSDSTSEVQTYRYCTGYDDQHKPLNAIVIQPENSWSGNLIQYEKGEMNVMAYKDMRSPDKARFFFKDLGKSWKYGGQKVELNIRLNESYGDLLTVQVTQLGGTEVLDEQVYIRSDKLANYAPGECK